MLTQHISNYTALDDHDRRDCIKAATVVSDQFCIAGRILPDERQAMAKGDVGMRLTT